MPSPSSFLGRFPCGWTSLSGMPAFFFFFPMRDSREGGGDEKKGQRVHSRKGYFTAFEKLLENTGNHTHRQRGSLQLTGSRRSYWGSVSWLPCCLSPLSRRSYTAPHPGHLSLLVTPRSPSSWPPSLFFLVCGMLPLHSTHTSPGLTRPTPSI